MARRLSDELNELKITDNISNSSIVLYYRTPTAREQVRYTNEAMQRKRNKLVSHLGEMRQEGGLKILEGFREGDFEIPVAGEKGKYAPLSSDPESNLFIKEWKDRIKQYAPDIIEALAIHAFESNVEIEEPEEAEDRGQTAEDGGQRTDDSGEDLDQD